RSMAATPASTTTAGANGTLAGYTIRYSIWNHRDARAPRYQTLWNNFVDANAPAMLDAIRALGTFLTLDPRFGERFHEWQVDNQNAISKPEITSSRAFPIARLSHLNTPTHSSRTCWAALLPSPILTLP